MAVETAASPMGGVPMIRIALPLLAAALLAVGFQAAPAQAQLSRTAVSALRGNDANNCDVLTPCRTFQRAHDATNSDGEVTVLDPGGYGAFTITKSISVVNDGVGEASILVSGGAVGITINAGAAAYINLRGITIQGIGFGGGSGILFNSGFALTITHCVIRNHTSHGITFAPTAAAARLAISDTLVADNGGHGILVNPAGAANNVKVDLDHVAMRNNSQTGAFLSGAPGGMHASIADSVV